ncbi:family 4 glycosyl hydrolase [Paenibacillus sp. y28]|uniref:family 4 glycosyl hydrolase n=1 Tax=Paenibacillus sp. y28 TaxID=3129110 RepID=UPI003019DD17
MANQNPKSKNLTITYIGGGSKGWAWGLMSDLAVEPELAGTVRLYDIDAESAQNNAIIGNRLSQRPDVVGNWTYEAVLSLSEALEGTDFVIISIVPGSLEEMRTDVHLPEEYGIYQSVGDTVGPGGLMRALRTIPIYTDIAKHIERYAPEAWVINYTNPMTLCVRTLYAAFPGIKAFGCCHEVFGTQKLMAKMLTELHGEQDVKREDIKVNVLGINHFTWLDSATYQGRDLFPLYRDLSIQYAEEGFELRDKGHWMNSTFSSANRIHFDLFNKYGLIAAAGDRHLAEFMPLNWYLKDPETVKSWKFGLTTVDWRVKNKVQLLEKAGRLVRGEQEFELKETGEEGVKMIKALLGLGELATNVNLPNQGQLGGVPLGAVVETNALFSEASLRPVMAGTLPAAVNALVNRHVLNQETILEAALTKNKALALAAMLNDPLASSIPPDQATEMFNRMFEATKRYLPGWE